MSSSSSSFPNVWPKVVLLGDSLTQFSFDEQGGWGSKLQSLLKRKADVLNRGFSGYNSNSLKLVLPHIFNPDFMKDVACLTLCIGANDSWEKTNLPKFNPSVPVDQYKKNLKEIIEFLLENGLTKDKIILFTPPTIVVEDWLNFCKQMKEFVIEKTPEKTLEYALAMLDVAKKMDITCLNTFELTSREEHVKKSFVDGLHFSSYGGDLVYNLIKDHVEKRVKKHRNTDLENLPTYSDIDFNNLETFPFQP